MKKLEKISTSRIVDTSKEMIDSQEFLKEAKMREQDFTRNRKMPFGKLVLFMLNMVKTSTKTALNRFFELIGQPEVEMSQQAFSEARQKINWTAFFDLFVMTVNETYSFYYETWNGYRVSAIDGMKIQLPADDELRETFGTVGKGNTSPTAQSSALYDVYNNILMDAHMDSIKTDERTMAFMHIDALCSLPSFKENKELIVFDRGYASYDLIAYLKSKDIHFLMRVKKKFNKSIDTLPAGDHFAALKKKDEDDVNVRVLKFPLPSGEIETLITDIADEWMDINVFKNLYFKRWPIETKYNEIKNKLEVENFSSLTENGVLQDFFISMYMSNVVAIGCMEAQPSVDEYYEYRGVTYQRRINVNDAIGTYKDRFIEAILEPRPRIRKKKIERILFLLIKSTVPIRPGRSAPRNASPRKSKFHHNKKSNC